MFITYRKKELKRNLACLLQYPVTLKDALCWEWAALKHALLPQELLSLP